MRTIALGMFCLAFAAALIAYITSKELGWLSATCGWAVVLIHEARDRFGG